MTASTPPVATPIPAACRFERFAVAAAVAGLTGAAARRAYNELILHWSAEGRYHHDLSHLAEALDIAAEIGRGLPGDWLLIVELALWYHDAIYDPQKPDNEAQSAALARTHLPDPIVAEWVAQLVLTTIDHQLPSDPELRKAAEVLLDADLGVLAGTAPR